MVPVAAVAGMIPGGGMLFEEGEIDFIAASELTDTPYEPELIHGRSVDVETPEEIVAKKLRFRAGGLKVRDVFDISVVLKHRPERLLATLIFQYACMVPSPYYNE